MPGHLARQTTMPSLPEGEEDHAGRGLGIVLKTVVALFTDAIVYHYRKRCHTLQAFYKKIGSPWENPWGQSMKGMNFHLLRQKSLLKAV